MNQHTTTQPPVDPVSTDSAPATHRRRRRLVIPAVVAALALGTAGSGVGYAAANRLSTPSAGTAQGSSSTHVQQTFHGGPGYAGGGYFNDPYGSTTSPYGGYSSGGTSPVPGTPSTDTTAKASGSKLTGLVRIATTLKYDGAKAAGTGMVLTSGGEVVTNHHVVAGATRITVKVMSTGQAYTARVVGTDATDDVAVLQLVGASGLATVAPDKGRVASGEAVTAVGDGNGTVGYLSAATGSVLATGQSITTQSDGTSASERLNHLIEISSNVVAGYSGGATYDASGHVVGMTTAASSGGSNVVGYAIPIAKVLRIANDLEAGTHNTNYSYGYPAFLGVGLASGTTVQGTYAGTPAARAGIVTGDRIGSVGGIRTSTATQLHAAIASHSPGDAVAITWTHIDGTRHSATVTLGTGPVQ
jgi:S1-C subfamily serine protease